GPCVLFDHQPSCRAMKPSTASLNSAVLVSDAQWPPRASSISEALGLATCNAATSKVWGCDASKRSAIEGRTRARTVMEMPAKQRTPESSEIVKLIRKSRWAGLEEKAEHLEKELEQRTVTDTVVSIQNGAAFATSQGAHVAVARAPSTVQRGKDGEVRDSNSF